jgi:hypothetical protein
MVFSRKVSAVCGLFLVLGSTTEAKVFSTRRNKWKVKQAQNEADSCSCQTDCKAVHKRPNEEHAQLVTRKISANVGIPDTFGCIRGDGDDDSGGGGKCGDDFCTSCNVHVPKKAVSIIDYERGFGVSTPFNLLLLLITIYLTILIVLSIT